MSRISKCALGLIAASLALGGVQFGMASDNGLARAIRGDARLWQTDSLSIASAVNRSAKSDRAVALPAPMDTATLSFQLPGLTNMSVAMRLPSADASRLRPAAPTEVARTTSRDVGKTMVRRKTTVACEPVVSVLTEVARQLEPGRCIT